MPTPFFLDFATNALLIHAPRRPVVQQTCRKATATAPRRADERPNLEYSRLCRRHRSQGADTGQWIATVLGKLEFRRSGSRQFSPPFWVGVCCQPAHYLGDRRYLFEHLVWFDAHVEGSDVDVLVHRGYAVRCVLSFASGVDEKCAR
jgi:hypothetical protein